VERRLHTAGKSKARLDPFMPAKKEDVAHLRETLGEIHEVGGREGGREGRLSCPFLLGVAGSSLLSTDSLALTLTFSPSFSTIPPPITSRKQVFKDHIKARRGSKIAGHEDIVFSGDFFTGARGMELGLVDGIGSLQSVAKEKLGEKVRINYINARPRFPFFPGLSTMVSYLEGGGGVEGGGEGGSVTARVMDEVLGAVEERVEERMWRSRVGL
jgi:ClpP class serine protease